MAQTYANNDNVLSKVKFGNITYIPLSVPKENFLVKLKNRIFLNHIDEEVSLWPIYREVYLRVIDKYKPDVIQVFLNFVCIGFIAESRHKIIELIAT